MRERPSLVALLALSRQIQVPACASGLFACSGPLSAFTMQADLPFVACPYSPPNSGFRRRFPNARLQRLAVRSARAVRPAAASGRSCCLDAEESSTVGFAPSLFVLRGRAAPTARLVQAPAMRPAPRTSVRFPPRGKSLLAETWPNPSIERTVKSTLRVLSPAAHVKR